MKPILVNKEEQHHEVKAVPNPVNHFEETKPKDDLLLKRKESVRISLTKSYFALYSS